MGQFNTLMARDGHEFRAWLSAPSGTPRGAIVVVQEIFGINSHIRAVTDGYAAEGYVAIAPSLFDRVRKGIEIGYSASERQEGFGYVAQLKHDQIMKDLSAAIAVVKHAGRVGMVGFCWGGKVAYLSASEPLPITCGVAYYGGSIAKSLDKTPKRPMMYHFGELDQHIPLSDIEAIKAANPEGIFYTYPGADHAFNRAQHESYHAPSAALARERTLAFFAQHVARERADEGAPT
jgi:carboxymethylenebutenolidase